MSSLGFFIPIIIILVLWFFIMKTIAKRNKKAEINSNILDAPNELSYNYDIDLELKGKIDFKSYRKDLMKLSYKKPGMIIIAVGLSFCLISSIQKVINNPSDFYNYVAPVFFSLAFLIPVWSMYRLKKLYYESDILSLEQKYHITNNEFSINGPSMHSKTKWPFFTKFSETQHFFLLYGTGVSATFLSKDMFTSEEIVEFKNLLSAKNIKTV